MFFCGITLLIAITWVFIAYELGPVGFYKVWLFILCCKPFPCSVLITSGALTCMYVHFTIWITCTDVPRLDFVAVSCDSGKVLAYMWLCKWSSATIQCPQWERVARRHLTIPELKVATCTRWLTPNSILYKRQCISCVNFITPIAFGSQQVTAPDSINMKHERLTARGPYFCVFWFLVSLILFIVFFFICKLSHWFSWFCSVNWVMGQVLQVTLKL